MEGNDKAKINNFGLNNVTPNDPLSFGNLVTIYRDKRITTDYNRINFNNAENLQYREIKRPIYDGIQLNFEGNPQINRNKTDEAYHYGNLYNNVIKSLGITTPVRTKIDINVDYTPNSTIVKI